MLKFPFLDINLNPWSPIKAITLKNPPYPFEKFINRKKSWLLLLPLLCVGLIISGCGRISVNNEDQLRQVFAEGLEFIEMYDIPRALDRLRPAYHFVSPGHEKYDEIAYIYALALWQFTPVRPAFIEESNRIFTSLIETTEDGSLRRRATLDLGRILEVSNFRDDPRDIEGARALYRKVYTENPADHIGETALLFYANTFLKVYDNEANIREGIDILRQHLEEVPDGPLANLAWQLKGNAYIQNFNDKQNALRAYENAYQIGFADIPRIHIFFWFMGRWALGISDYDSAVKWFTKIVEETPRSVYGTLARENVLNLSLRFPERNYRVPELQSFGEAVIE